MDHDPIELWEKQWDAVKTPSVSWFPPHMHKAHKRLAVEIKNINVVLEVRDARLPLTSGNSELDLLIGKRKRVILFNKSSLSQSKASQDWMAYFKNHRQPTLFLDAESSRGLNLLFPILQDLLKESQDNLLKRGIRPPPARLMIVGIPNVGKSTLINRMTRQKKLRTAPTPGVTKGVEWVTLKKKYLLMDTPGVILPKLVNPVAALKLGWIGAIRDSIFGEERLATTLLDYLLDNNPGALSSRYNLPAPLPEISAILFENIGKKRGLLRAGSAFDPTNTANMILSDFRAGKLGKYTLELPAK